MFGLDLIEINQIPSFNKNLENVLSKTIKMTVLS